MIASIKRRGLKSSFSKLADYILSDNNDKRRVLFSWSSNCSIENSFDFNKMEILNTQAMNKRSNADKTLHIVVSLGKDERLSQTQFRGVEEAICRELGLQGHQRICVVHNDTEYLHMHMAISKINPLNKRNVTPFQSHTKLMKICRDFEVEFNLTKGISAEKAQLLAERQVLRSNANKELKTLEIRIVNRVKNFHSIILNTDCSTGYLNFFKKELEQEGLELRLLRGAIVIQDIKTNLYKELSGFDKKIQHYCMELPNLHDHILPIIKVPLSHVRYEPVKTKAEIYRCEVSFRTWVKENSLQKLISALEDVNGNWESFNNCLATNGLVLKKKGAGFVMEDVVGTYSLKPSDLSRKLSKNSLERRFGPYEEPKIKLNSTERYRPHLKSASEVEKILFERYSARKKVARSDRKLALDAVRKDFNAEKVRALKLFSFPRWSSKHVGYIYRTPELEVRLAEIGSQRKRLTAMVPKSKTWIQWLCDEAVTDEIALGLLRSKYQSVTHGNSITGNSSNKIGHKFESMSVAIDVDGAVVYNTEGRIFRDYGNKVVLQSYDKDTVRLAIMLSIEKWGVGSLQFSGTESFKKLASETLLDMLRTRRDPQDIAKELKRDMSFSIDDLLERKRSLGR